MSCIGARFSIAIYARVFPGHKVLARERGERAWAAEQLQLRGGQPLPAQGERFRTQVSAGDGVSTQSRTLRESAQ